MFFYCYLFLDISPSPRKASAVGIISRKIVGWHVDEQERSLPLGCNPYSEALFCTVKYVPAYPGCFESVQHARTYLETFVHWYNHTHYHSGINFVTPAQRHDGDDRQVLARRKHVYAQARARHPERWSRNTRNWGRVETVLLNPEKSKTQNATWAVAA